MRFKTRAKRQALFSGEAPVNEILRGGRGLAWKRFVAWVVVPMLLFCMTEMGLRLAGFGHSVQLFVPQEIGGKTVYTSNHFFYDQFFLRPIGQYVHEFCIPATKPAGTYRVFVFGSSAAEGKPMPETSFSCILEAMLRARHHEGKIEIYNLAKGGANSHVMRAAAKACASHQPDLFVIYMGNNDLSRFVTKPTGWDWLPIWLTLPLIDLRVPINELRVVQLMRGDSKQNPHYIPDPDPNIIVPDPDRAYQYYRSNVNDMCDYAKAAGAQVILCSVGTRLRELPPGFTHASTSNRKKEQDDACEAGDALREQGRIQDAMAVYTRAEGIDDEHAGLAYGIASCHYALGEYGAARAWFVRARELDSHEYPRGAGNRINSTLRGIAEIRARDGVHFLDSVQALANASPHGIEGPELFVDEVHFSFEGKYILARSVLEALAKSEPRLGIQVPPASLEECQARMAFSPPDHLFELKVNEKLLKQCQLRRKYTLYELLVGNQKQLDIELSMAQIPDRLLENEIAELEAKIGPNTANMRLDAYRNAMQIDPQNETMRPRYIQALIDKGDTANALEQERILIDDLPYSIHAPRLLMQLYAKMGDRKRAIETIRQLLTWQPNYAEAYLLLGYLLCEEKQPKAALAAYRDSFRITASPEALQCIARIRLEQGDVSGAIQAYRLSLKVGPGSFDFLEEFISALCDGGHKTEAKSEIERWCATNGEQGSGIAVLYEKAGQMQHALQIFKSNITSSPGEDENCSALAGFLNRNVSAIPALPVWKELAEKTSSACVRLAYENALSVAASLCENAGQIHEALQMLESKAMFLGGDMGSCADLEQFLKRNASTFSAPALWEKIAEKTPSEQVWISYERSFGETDSEKHITVLRQMLQGAPGNGYCAFKLQGLLDDKAGRRDVAGDLPGAVSVYQEAIPLDTQNTQPVQGLEKALSKCNPAERRDVWEKTWRDNPGSPQVAAFCGTARVAAGDIAGAREAFAASQSLAPEDWYSCVLAADALAAVGAWGDAAAAYRRALEQNPKLDYLLPRLEEAGKFDDDCFALQEG